MDVTAHQVSPEEPNIPIGKPISNIQCYVLDGELNPAPIGVASAAAFDALESLASMAPMQPTRKVSTCVSLPG